MPKKGGKTGGGAGGGDKRLQMFAAINKQKLEGVRWSFLYGGQQVSTRNDEGLTPLMVCAMENKNRALDNILEILGRQLSKRGGSSRSEAGEAVDGLELTDDDGKTALMMACMNGNFQAAQMLVKAGALLHTKDSEGNDARWHANAGKYRHIVQWIDNGGQIENAGDDDEGDEDEDELIEGESKTARNRRLRREKEKKEAGEAYGEQDDDKVADAAEDSKQVFETDADDAKAPVWEEVIRVHESCKGPGASILELNVTRTENCDAVDPAVWRCLLLNRLQLMMPTGVLNTISPKLSRLKSLETLILSHNSIVALPDAIGSLLSLKILEIEENQLTSVPSAEVLENIKQLQVLNVAGNRLTDGEVEKLGACMGSNLATLRLDRNQLTKLPIPWDRLNHLSLFTASENSIDELSAGVGELTGLITLDLSNNQIRDIPCEMGDLSEKKFKDIKMDSNPLKDHRVKRILEKEKLPVKPLLMHLRKQGGGVGKGGKKKGKSKATAQEEAEPVSAPPAESCAGGDAGNSNSDHDSKLSSQAVNGEATPELIGRKIRYVYHKKNPEKISDVAKLMIKYKGKEAALYRAMVKKYEFDESFFDDMPPEEDSTEEENEESSDENDQNDDQQDTDESALELTAENIGQRVHKIYEAKNPEKIEDVPKLMLKYKGKELALYKAIMNKYKIQNSFFAAEDAQLREEADLKADPAEQARLKKIEEQKKREEEEMAAYLQKAKDAEADAAIDDEILALKTKMMAVKAQGRANALAGESDAAEREEYRHLKQQIETLEAEKQARHAPEPEPEPVPARWQPRQIGGKGKGGGKGKLPGSSNAILVRSLDIGKIIGKGGQTIKAIQAKSGARINISKKTQGEWTEIEIEGTPQMVTSVKMQIEKITGNKCA